MLLKYSRALTLRAAAAMLFGLLPWSPAARADTVATLLGNFTINQFCGLGVGADEVRIHYVVVFGQLPALRELHMADVNADGVTTPAERDAYLARLAADYVRGLQVKIGDHLVPLHVERLASSLPSEQAGFSLRFDADFAGPLAPSETPRRIEFVNSNYSGRIGWHEVAVSGLPGTSVYESTAYADSLTDGLSFNPKALPPEGPLDEREARFSFVAGIPPAGAAAPRHRLPSAAPGVGSVAGAPPAGPRQVSAADAGGNWLAVQTKRLLSMLSGPTVSLQIKLLALGGALVLGALHAFSPGHGKTVVGAYLIGSRGTPRHAVFLGVIVTVTHTLGVFLLGFATLFAARYIVPERLFPIVSLLSGLLVVGIGGNLFVQRVRSQRREAGAALFVPVGRTAHVPLALAPNGASRLMGHGHGPGFGDGSLVHSHGGSTHSHLPAAGPGERITWRSLLALGVSGGLIPCPSAMVLLLAAVALDKTALGLLLVVSFSIGLAVTLTVVGLAFLYARRLFPRTGSSSRWARQLPIASAALITLVGIVICYGAIAGKNIPL